MLWSRRADVQHAGGCSKRASGGCRLFRSLTRTAPRVPAAARAARTRRDGSTDPSAANTINDDSVASVAEASGPSVGTAQTGASGSGRTNGSDTIHEGSDGRCQSLTARGTRCSRRARPGMLYCHVHGSARASSATAGTADSAATTSSCSVSTETLATRQKVGSADTGGPSGSDGDSGSGLRARSVAREALSVDGLSMPFKVAAAGSARTPAPRTATAPVADAPQRRSRSRKGKEDGVAGGAAKRRRRAYDSTPGSDAEAGTSAEAVVAAGELAHRRNGGARAPESPAVGADASTSVTASAYDSDEDLILEFVRRGLEPRRAESSVPPATPPPAPPSAPQGADAATLTQREKAALFLVVISGALVNLWVIKVLLSATWQGAVR